MSGWFAMKRGITQHHLFKENPARLAIWVWLLDNACWKDTPHDINGKTITVPRGSVCVSLRRLAREVGVGLQVVRTFLDRLEGDHMINTAPTHGRTLITLCNWDKYQVPDRSANTAANTAVTHDQHIKEQVNNIPVGNAPRSPAEIIFSQGVALLMAGGQKEAAAKSILGKMRKDHGDERLIAALGQTHRAGAIEPVGYLRRVLSDKAKQTERAGHVASGAFGNIPERN